MQAFFLDISEHTSTKERCISMISLLHFGAFYYLSLDLVFILA